MDTPFPFPWAQAVNLVLIIFSVTAPFVIVAHTTSIATACAITFAAVHTHVMLNEVRPPAVIPALRTFCFPRLAWWVPQQKLRMARRHSSGRRRNNGARVKDVPLCTQLTIQNESHSQCSNMVVPASTTVAAGGTGHRRPLPV
jgi:hypothetical protein